MSRPAPALLGAAFALLCVIWGTTWSVIQIGLRGIPPYSGVALRFGLAGGLLLALALARGVRLGGDRRERRLWPVNATLSYAVPYALVYWCEQWVPSGLTAVLWATYPLFVALLAHLFLPGERVSLRDGAGVLVGFAGVGVIFSADFGALGGERVALASAVLLLSPAVAAVASVAVKRWGGHVHPLSLTSVPMLLGAALAGLAALAFERDVGIDWTVVSVGALVYLAVIGTAVTFTIFFWLLSWLPARRLSLISFIVPVVAVSIGTLRGEPLTARTVAGSLLVVGGVGLAVWQPRSAAAAGAPSGVTRAEPPVPSRRP